MSEPNRASCLELISPRMERSSADQSAHELPGLDSHGTTQGRFQDKGCAVQTVCGIWICCQSCVRMHAHDLAQVVRIDVAVCQRQ